MAALATIAPDGGPLTLDQLGGFDEFHSGGRMATDQLAAMLSPTAVEVVLDAGCGLGGSSRYLADRFGCRVVGVDLTPEFVDVARHLNERTGLDGLVDVRVGDLTALELDDDAVDAAWMCHVSMNVADKATMFAEVARVLRPGGRLGLFEVVAGGAATALELPVPWATDASGSHLVTADALRALLTGAGLVVEDWRDPTEPVMAAVRGRYEEVVANPPDPDELGMHTYLPDLTTRVGAYVRNTEAGRTALVMCVARLPAS
jgi:SAM-dependent methyltransferase